MKIKKFNEKLDIENITVDSIINIAKIKNQIAFLKNQYNMEFNNIKDYLDRYLVLHPELQEKNYELNDDDVLVKEISMLNDEYIKILYWNEPPYDLEELKTGHLSKTDLVDFISYVKNPDIYEISKKYNL